MSSFARRQEAIHVREKKAWWNKFLTTWGAIGTHLWWQTYDADIGHALKEAGITSVEELLERA